MGTKQTSRMAYDDLRADGKASTQRAKVLGCVINNTLAMTRQEIARDTGLTINAVCGRVNELVKQELLRVAYIGPCQVTRKQVECLREV